MRRKIILSAVLLLFFGCNPAKKKQGHTVSYFDLKGYFAKEEIRLNRSNPIITKTVKVNEASETKKMHIADWSLELSVFSAADINRNAWKGLFNAKNTEEQELYTTDLKKIPVKDVLIIKQNGQVKHIRVLIRYDNMLYSSADTLSYYPDSLYQIRKKQKIRLLSEKNYNIIGTFN